jgi:hypothetical protein
MKGDLIIIVDVEAEGDKSFNNIELETDSGGSRLIMRGDKVREVLYHPSYMFYSDHIRIIGMAPTNQNHTTFQSVIWSFYPKA